MLVAEDLVIRIDYNARRLGKGLLVVEVPPYVSSGVSSRSPVPFRVIGMVHLDLHTILVVLLLCHIAFCWRHVEILIVIMKPGLAERRAAITYGGLFDCVENIRSGRGYHHTLGIDI